MVAYGCHFPGYLPEKSDANAPLFGFIKRQKSEKVDIFSKSIDRLWILCYNAESV